MASYMKVIMATIPRRHPEIEILEVNTDQDHIHLLASIAPKMAISDAVRILKSNTGRMMTKKFPFIRHVYHGEMSLWSIGYFVSTVGVNERTSRPTLRTRVGKIVGKQRLNSR